MRSIERSIALSTSVTSDHASYQYSLSLIPHKGDLTPSLNVSLILKRVTYDLI
jgi:hypothetical protein